MRLASARDIDDKRQKEHIFRFAVSFRTRPGIAATCIGVRSGYRQGVRDSFQMDGKHLFGALLHIWLGAKDTSAAVTSAYC